MSETEGTNRHYFHTSVAPAGLSIPLNEAAGERVAYQIAAVPLEYSYYCDDGDTDLCGGGDTVHMGTLYQLDFAGRNDHIFVGTLGFKKFPFLGFQGIGGMTDQGDPVFGAQVVLSDPVLLFFTPIPAVVPGLTAGYQAIPGDQTEHRLYLQLQASLFWNVLFED